MIVTHYAELYGTDREVDCPKGGFKSLRLLLEADGMGFTMTLTKVPKGPPQRWHYKNHLEACYCVQGKGKLTNLKTKEVYQIGPGVTYALDENDDHMFQAMTDVVLVCVFNPPLKGREVHRKDGSYE